MNSKYAILLLVLFLGSAFTVNGQKDLKKKGDMYFESNNFAKAIKYYSRMQNINKSSKALLRRAISHFNLNELSAAQRDLMALSERKKEKEQVDYYLGRISHHNLEFEKAVRYYKSHLRFTKKDDPMRPMIRNLIAQCGTGLQVLYQDPTGFVENLGPEINTREDEFGLIQSPTFTDVFYFTSNRVGSAGGLRNEKGIRDDMTGRYYYDMYKVVRDKNEWFQVEPLDPIMNSYRHDVLLDFASDGNSMLYYQSKDNEELIIFNDEFSENRTAWKLSEEFESTIYGDLGDKYVQMYNDQTLIFSSKRPGGYGGYDLYVSTYTNNKWSEPRNLGPNVNTNFDEVSPFLVRNGRRLYFSSNSPKSIGGQDVFYSDFLLNSKKWGEPVNIGIPINSAEDDMYFRLMNDGMTASFSSNRKECIGGFDLHFAYLKDQDPNHISIGDEISYVNSKREEEQIIEEQEEVFVDNTPKEIAVEPEEEFEEIVVVDVDTIIAKEREVIAEVQEEKRVDPIVEEKKSTVQESKPKDIVTVPVEERVEELIVATPEPKKNYSINKKKEVEQPKTEFTEFTIKPLFYSNPDQILTTTNTNKLDEVVKLLKFYQGSTVELNCSTSEEGATPHELYFTIERAEHAALYLNSKGIDKDRIAIKGLGNNYPLIKNEEVKSSKVNLNKRIDIVVQNINELTTPIFVEEPNVVNQTKKYIAHQEAIKGVSYKVQIITTKKMYQNQVLKFYDDPLIEKDILSGDLMYSVGLEKQYTDAMKLKTSLVNGGFENAEIIPYFNGKRIDNDKLKNYSEVFPDLKNLISFAD